MHSYTRALAVSFLAMSSFLGAPQAQAVTDYKSISAVACLPYGPNTLLSELSYTQKGITNPGTTNESVLCSIVSDGDQPWGPTAGASANWYAFYQAGAIPGRVACTAFVSNAAMSGNPVYSVTVNPANQLAGARNYLTLPLADTSNWGIGAPTMALCTITPKATLGGFTMSEGVITNTP